MDNSKINSKRLFNYANIAQAVFVLLLLFLPMIVTGYYLHSIILVLMYAVLGCAWNWLGGFAGQISLAHAVFFGLGAYVNGLCQVWFGMNPWLAAAISVVLVGIFSIIIGIPTFRLKGHYFAIATIAIGEIVKILFVNWPGAGGAVGLYLPIKDSSLVNFQFYSKIPYYYIILIILFLAILITKWLKNSKYGYYFRAIKEDPDASKAVGIDIVRTKLLAMALSGSVCALVGSFYLNYVLFIDPESVFLFMNSVKIALIAVLGGMGTVYGPVVGSFIIILLSEASRIYFGGMGAGLDLIIYGLLIMLIAIYQPDGLVGAFENMIRKRRRKRTSEKVQEEHHG